MKTYLVLFSIVLALVAGLAWADSGANQRVGGVTALGMTPRTSTPYRTVLGSADAAGVESSTVAALSPVYCGGFREVYVHGRFSGNAATAVVACVRYNADGTVKSVKTATLTAGTYQDNSGRYLAPETSFPTMGASYVKILTAAPSAGVVDLWIELE